MEMYDNKDVFDKSWKKTETEESICPMGRICRTLKKGHCRIVPKKKDLCPS
jgi:hypothetical protein